MITMLDDAVVTFFETSLTYERNNRTGGCKSLRCFPSCNVTGHTTAGFCGRVATILLHIRGSQSRSSWEKDLVVVAELRPSRSIGLSSQRTVLIEHIDQNIRTPTDPFLPYIEGSVGIIHVSRSTDKPHEIESTLEINFNENVLAWHYGWKSNKHVSDHKHVVDVVILVKGKNEQSGVLMPIGSFLSEEFLVTSTRAVKELSKREQKLQNIDELGDKVHFKIPNDDSICNINPENRSMKKNHSSRTIKKRKRLKTKKTKKTNKNKINEIEIDRSDSNSSGSDIEGSNARDSDLLDNITFVNVTSV